MFVIWRRLVWKLGKYFRWPGNANAFSHLQKVFWWRENYFKITYFLILFISNRLNRKKFVFPTFELNISDDIIHVPEGFISSKMFYDFHEKDDKVKNWAPKLTNSAVHLGYNKQNVSLALAIPTKQLQLQWWVVFLKDLMQPVFYKFFKKFL